MTRATIKVHVESSHAAFVNGYGARDMLTELRGRPPVWATLTRAWVTTEAVAMDLVAMAERRNYDVVLTSEKVYNGGGPPRWSEQDHLADSGRISDPGGLW